ncbi:hypothetical protein JCM3765_004304 [Sporobolomyces pararoseus]
MLNIPLQPFEFPPATSRDIPSTVHPRHQQTASTSTSKPHRHSEKINNALELLKTLSDQAVTPAPMEEREDEGKDDQPEEGIIANLASHGWTHQTTNNGIRIFQLDSEADTFVPTPNDPALRSSTALERSKTNGSARTRGAITSPGIGGGSGMASSTRRGARADEVLPFFRGEGWIEGSWRKEDVAATIVSQGAREQWDPRFDSSKSQIVELLSESDTLVHMHIKGSFVADRDACMVTTRANDDREGKENVLYVAACSVDDPLVPSTASRTSVHLNGFTIRSLPRAPHFEPPPPPQASTTDTVLIDLPPTRPSHRRTKSSVSVIHNHQNNHNFLSPHPPLPSSNPFNSLSAPLNAPIAPPPPPPLNQTFSSSTLATSSNGAPPSEPESAFPFPLTFQSQNQNSALHPPTATRPLPGNPSNRPGLAVSMLIRASPGYNLPHSMLQQLSVHLPLSISAIGRFLSSHGFAPYLVRNDSRIKLREEEFDAISAKYQAIFSVEKGAADEIRIRFYGGTFGRRFDVEVQHVKPEGWRIDFDVPPPPFEEPVSEHTQEELGGAGSGRWRASVTLQTQRANDLRQRTRFEDSPSVGSPGSIPDDSHTMDPAQLPGPLGGCTIVIDASATTLHLPVIVSISRPCTDLASQPKAMRGRSKALAQAAAVALDDNSILCNSLEEFLETGRDGDERAELYLRGAKTVLRELERATLEEGRASSRLATSALFGGGEGSGWRGSPRSPNRPLASPRRLGRPPSSLSLRFANS